MRIINGIFKGKQIIAPPNLPTRPTTDFAKEGLFNILTNRIDFESVKFLDLFCGTGNITWEIASRGCTDITCVDDNNNCCSFVTKTAADFKLPNIKIYRNDAFRFCETTKETYDLIFADPPFIETATIRLPEIIFAKHLLKPTGILIIEHPVNISFKDFSAFIEERKYGKIRFSFFSNHE